MSARVVPLVRPPAIATFADPETIPLVLLRATVNEHLELLGIPELADHPSDSEFEAAAVGIAGARAAYARCRAALWVATCDDAAKHLTALGMRARSRRTH